MRVSTVPTTRFYEDLSDLIRLDLFDLMRRRNIIKEICSVLTNVRSH